MRVMVNGAEQEIADGATVATLIEALGLGGPVAVAVNQDVVTRSTHGAHLLHAGDRIDIVTAVQGG